MSESNETSSENLISFISLADRRRGLGWIFGVAGVLHWGLMIFAALYSQGKFPNLIVTVRQWNHAYIAHFVWMFVFGGLRVARRFSRKDAFTFQLLVDFLVGLSVFWTLFRIVRFILVRSWLTPWISLLPGLFLLYYGYGLYRGRQIWSGLDLV